MIKIEPAILATSEIDFKEKLSRVRPLGMMVQIDVTDGAFVDTVTWSPPEKMEELLDGLPFEAHLMVANPEHAVGVWLAAGAARVFFHLEATERESLILNAAAADGNGDKVGVAINPDTPISRLMPIIDRLRFVLVMGVNPGRGGQQLQSIAADKVAALKRLRPSLTVSVDGGVNAEDAGLLARAGADILVVGSALTNDLDPQLALARIRDAVQNDK